MKSYPSSIRQQILASSVVFYAGLVSQRLDLSGDTVVRHLNHHDQFHFLLRTNRTLVLALLWAALAACVVASLVYDVADWVGAW
jgi:hypothetical protein